MPSSRLRLTTTLALLAAAACANGATAPRDAAPAADRAAGAASWRGDTLRLPFGAAADLPGGATLAFVAVGDDSRCPINALCVAAGDASITVRVSAGGAGGERALHTDPRAGADTLTAGATALRLFGLTPLPWAPGPRAADADYVALFVAVRR